MQAVVQTIFTTWSKEYRGGPKAAERNRVPEAQRVPQTDLPVSDRAYLLHTSQHRFGDMPGLGRPTGADLQLIPVEQSLNIGCVWVHWLDGRLAVDYHWTGDAGMPERHTRRGVLNLLPDQWGRIRYNARISAYHTLAGWDCVDWWYEKWVVNIGLFARFEPDVFLKTESVKVHTEMDLLW